MLTSWYGARERLRKGINDFIAFYCGAQLIGTPRQFEPAAYREAQIRATGYYGAEWRYLRLPAFVLPIRPLGRLPYLEAYALWETALLAAFAGFLILWPAQDRALLVLTCCWSFPLAATLANGQDDAFLLLSLALAFRLASSLPWLAGAMLALGAAKFHLFSLVPLVLVAGRRWRILGGFAASVMAILGLSFAAAGPHWIEPYLSLILNPAVSPEVRMMPNLHGFFSGWHYQGTWEAAATLMVVALVAVIAWRGSLKVGLGCAVAGGILIGRHTYNADLVLLIPALSAIGAAHPSRILRWLTVLLLVPFWFILPVLREGFGGHSPLPVLILGVLLCSAASVLAAGDRISHA